MRAAGGESAGATWGEFEAGARHAWRVWLRRRRPRPHEADDSLSDALVGALEAWRRYDTSRAKSARSFAYQTAWCRMLDGLRARDVLARTHRAELEAAGGAGPLFASLSRPPEVAASGLDSPEGAEWRLPAPGPGPEEGAARADWWAETLSVLTPQAAAVIGWMYRDGLPAAEAARRLGVGESRVCQVHRQALARLREQGVPDWTF